MTRYERTQLFEALCHLRATYAARPEIDRRSELSIEDAIAYAEAVMFAVEAEDEEVRAFDELEAQQQTTALGDPRD